MKCWTMSCVRPSNRSSRLALPSGPSNTLVLLDRDSWQLAAPGGDLLEGAHGLLLGGLQFLARGQPLGGRDYSRAHFTLLCPRGGLHLPPLRGWTDKVPGTHRTCPGPVLKGSREAEVREQFGNT